MKKLCLLLIVLAVIATSMLACGAEKEAQREETSGSTSSVTQNTSDGSSSTIMNICPPTVIIDGEEYRDWSIQCVGVAIEEDQIAGYITSVVDITTMPKQNDEANYSAMGAPYVPWIHEEYGEVYLIQRDRGWFILLPADYPIS